MTDDELQEKLAGRQMVAVMVDDNDGRRHSLAILGPPIQTRVYLAGCGAVDATGVLLTHQQAKGFLWSYLKLLVHLYLDDFRRLVWPTRPAG